MIARESYDASQENAHVVRVIVNGYEVNATKADCVKGTATLLLHDTGELVEVTGVAVEFLLGTPGTSLPNALDAMKYLAGRGPAPDPKKCPRWGSFRGQ